MFPCLKPPAASLSEIRRARPFVGGPFSTATVTVDGLSAFGCAGWWVTGALLAGVDELGAGVLGLPPEGRDSSRGTIPASASAAINTGKARRNAPGGPWRAEGGR